MNLSLPSTYVSVHVAPRSGPPLPVGFPTRSPLVLTSTRGWYDLYPHFTGEGTQVKELAKVTGMAGSNTLQHTQIWGCTSREFQISSQSEDHIAASWERPLRSPEGVGHSQ